MKNIQSIQILFFVATFILLSCNSGKPTKTKADCIGKDQSEAYQFGRDVRTFIDLTGNGAMTLQDAILYYSKGIDQSWLAELYKPTDECVQAGFAKNSKD
jgi:hypothetical protein